MMAAAHAFGKLLKTKDLTYQTSNVFYEICTTVNIKMSKLIKQ